MSRGDDTDNAAIARLDGATPADESDDLLPGEPTPISPRSRRLTAPIAIDVTIACPSCGQTATVNAKLSARVVRDSDGSGHLALRTRAAKAAHVCNQTVLGLAEGERVR